MQNLSYPTFLAPQRSVLGALEQAVQFNHLPDIEKRDLVQQLLLSAVGAVAGYFVGKKYGHPVLGVLGGLGAGSSVGDVASGKPVNAAVTAITETAAIGASLWCPAHPALGYVGGHAGASVLLNVLFQRSLQRELSLASHPGVLGGVVGDRTLDDQGR